MLFAPPQLLETRVFARLPDEMKLGETDPEFHGGQPAGSPTTSLLEGPSFDREGNLYCVDLPKGRILKVDRAGEFSCVVAYDGWPNGLKIHADGRIFVADYKHGIMELDPVSGVIKPYLVRARLERFKAVNDLFFAQDGTLYFTDQGLTGHHDPTGRLFRVDTNGRVSCLLDNVPSPNGVVMNLEETALYLAVTRANAIWRVPLTPDGDVAKVGTFIQLSGGIGPDGLALDAEGRLAIAHFGLGCVWIMSALGEPLYRIRSCEGKHTTNVAFGGPDNRTLFMTEAESATILAADLDVAGKPMFSHAAVPSAES